LSMTDGLLGHPPHVPGDAFQHFLDRVTLECIGLSAWQHLCRQDTAEQESRGEEKGRVGILGIGDGSRSIYDTRMSLNNSRQQSCVSGFGIGASGGACARLEDWFVT